MQGPSAGYAIYVLMSWDRFLALLVMFLLNNNDAMAGRGQPYQQGKKSLEILYKKVAEGLLANAIQKIQAQGQTKSQLAC
jgi:hypothetical protein